MAELTEDILNKIKRIKIETSTLAEELLAGAWHSAFKGKGMEFEEVREYIPGDEVRDIDWNVTARMNHPYVKRFREERELTVMLVVDVSASAHFGSGPELKSEKIAEIGAALAFAAIKNNDRIGLLLFTDRVEKYVPPKKGVRHVLRVIRELLVYKPQNRGTDLSKALHYMGNIQPKKSICFLITDALIEPNKEEVGVIARKHDLISIVVTDPHEADFPRMGWVNLKDLELDKTLVFNSNDSTIREQFRKKAEQRLNDHKRMFQKVGAGFIHIRSDERYDLPLKQFFKLRRIKH